MPAGPSFHDMGGGSPSMIASRRLPRMKNADPPAARAPKPKTSWWKRMFLCMSVQIHKENYCAYRDHVDQTHNQQLILHELRAIRDPSAQESAPPVKPEYVRYKDWNVGSSLVDWSDLTKMAKGKKLIPDSDDDEDEDEDDEGTDDDYAKEGDASEDEEDEKE